MQLRDGGIDGVEHAKALGRDACDRMTPVLGRPRPLDELVALEAIQQARDVGRPADETPGDLEAGMPRRGAAQDAEHVVLRVGDAFVPADVVEPLLQMLGDDEEADEGGLTGVRESALLHARVDAFGHIDGAGGAVLPQDVTGLLPPDARRSIATATVSPVAIEPFALHAAVALVAVLVGWLLLEGLRRVHPIFMNFPLFPLAMAGGGVLQWLAGRTGVAAYFDRATFQRLSGLALDLLVTAAIASMRLDLFVQNVAPFTLLMLAGTIWCLGSFVWLAPRMLPAPWFEPAIVVYGTQTAVAAVGLMLLRVVDPDQRTTAAQTFAARSAVIAPLLGGGLVTATMPLLVAQLGVAAMLAAVTAIAVLAWVWPGRYRVRR